MNIAFGTLIILFLLSPGFVIRYAFLKGPYSRKNFKPSLSDDVFWSVIPAVFIQLAGIICLKLIGYRVSVPDFYYLLIGSKTGINFKLVSEGFPLFFWYSIVILIFSFLLGTSARWAVTRFRLDRKFNILKVNNEWYYLFTGSYDQDIDLIQVDILAHSDEGNILYSGILKDFFLNKEGGIDRLYLVAVYRRRFSEDLKDTSKKPKKLDERYYNMPGDYFVIFGHEIINLNVTYYKLKDQEG